MKQKQSKDYNVATPEKVSDMSLQLNNFQYGEIIQFLKALPHCPITPNITNSKGQNLLKQYQKQVQELQCKRKAIQVLPFEIASCQFESEVIYDSNLDQNQSNHQAESKLIMVQDSDSEKILLNSNLQFSQNSIQPKQKYVMQTYKQDNLQEFEKKKKKLEDEEFYQFIFNDDEDLLKNHLNRLDADLISTIENLRSINELCQNVKVVKKIANLIILAFQNVDKHLIEIATLNHMIDKNIRVENKYLEVEYLPQLITPKANPIQQNQKQLQLESQNKGIKTKQSTSHKNFGNQKSPQLRQSSYQLQDTQTCSGSLKHEQGEQMKSVSEQRSCNKPISLDKIFQKMKKVNPVNYKVDEKQLRKIYISSEQNKQMVFGSPQDPNLLKQWFSSNYHKVDYLQYELIFLGQTQHLKESKIPSNQLQQNTLDVIFSIFLNRQQTIDQVVESRAINTFNKENVFPEYSFNLRSSKINEGSEEIYTEQCKQDPYKVYSIYAFITRRNKIQYNLTSLNFYREKPYSLDLRNRSQYKNKSSFSKTLNFFDTYKLNVKKCQDVIINLEDVSTEPQDKNKLQLRKFQLREYCNSRNVI